MLENKKNIKKFNFKFFFRQLFFDVQYTVSKFSANNKKERLRSLYFFEMLPSAR